MPTISEYSKDLEKMKSAPGFKRNDISISTSKGELKINLYGPGDFLKRMPGLIQTVASNNYNKTMFSALAKANKPLSILHTANRSLLGGGALPKPQAWYCLLCVTEVEELMLLFNTAGYNEKIHFEIKRGNKTTYKHQFDEIKYTLAHEFFHLWQFIDHKGTPKKGTIARSMYTQKLRNECWATRYTNGWRYLEKRTVRNIYRHAGINHNVDAISNYQ